MRVFRHRVSCALLFALAGTPTVHADVVAVVSARSAVGMLTKNQVTDIFLGKRARFPDGSAAVAIDQAESSAAREEFYRKLAAMSAAQIKAYWAKIIFTGRGQPPREAANDAEVKALLLANPSAIAYISPSAVDRTVRVVLTP